MKLLSQIFIFILILLLVGGNQVGNGFVDVRQSTESALESEVESVEEQVNCSILFSQSKDRSSLKKGLAQAKPFPLAANFSYKAQAISPSIKRIIAYCCYLL